MNVEAFASNFLEERRQAGLLRSLVELDCAQDRIIIIDSKKLINFCSNNYLGLANDPRLKEAATAAIKNYGTSSASSRLICGTLSLHKQLEEKIASFKKSQAALVFNSGYVANLGIISSLADKDSIIFSDRLNHASIVDAIILSRAKLARYNHNSPGHLEELLKKHVGIENKFIITDSVFSMDGDLAPLKAITQIAAGFKATLIIDEAHATGVFGPTGAGLAEELGVSNNIHIQMGTLSKGLGSFGAFACVSKNLADYFINASRPFIYTTSLPPACIGASLKAIEIVEKEPERREALWKNINFVREALVEMGFDCAGSAGAIMPIMIGKNKLTMEFSRKLFERGLFIQGVRPPTVPEGKARLRLTITASHTKDDLERLLVVMEETAQELAVI